MNRAMIENHLEMVDRHVRQGEVHIINQRSLIEDMAGKGLDTTEARRLLVQFEQIQELHVADCDRLRRELQALG